jgi:hypothetical protein
MPEIAPTVQAELDAVVCCRTIAVSGIGTRISSAPYVISHSSWTRVRLGLESTPRLAKSRHGQELRAAVRKVAPVGRRHAQYYGVFDWLDVYLTPDSSCQRRCLWPSRHRIRMGGTPGGAAPRALRAASP